MTDLFPWALIYFTAYFSVQFPIQNVIGDEMFATGRELTPSWVGKAGVLSGFLFPVACLVNLGPLWLAGYPAPGPLPQLATAYFILSPYFALAVCNFLSAIFFLSKPTWSFRGLLARWSAPLIHENRRRLALWALLSPLPASALLMFIGYSLGFLTG